MKKSTDREINDLALLIKKEINEKNLNLSEEERGNIYNRVVLYLKEKDFFKTLPKEKQKQLIYEMLIDEKNIFAFNIRETFLETFKTDYLVFQKLIFDLFARINYHEYFYTKNDSPSEKQDKYNKYKKPYLNLPVYFNISHSYDLVALVISKYEVGIDIEKVQTRKEKLADKIFSEVEMKEYQENKSDSYLIKKWTEKEAYFKLLGTGLILNELKQDYSRYVKSYKLEDNKEVYYLSVATNETININILEENIKIW